MKLDAIELFAGVGGFRVGLGQNFNFVWMNQWEPSTKEQHAFKCYEKHFGKQNIDGNINISLVNKKKIPNHSLLCAGFPCQDYSVARTLSNEAGIKGKKGVLWWDINETLSCKKTPFVLLENVDRLLISPSKQRGRDFGIILKCLSKLGYYVEWRVINASDYGMAQRRRRTYIFAALSSTKFAAKMKKQMPENILTKKGFFASNFSILDYSKIKSFDLNKYKDILSVSKNFEFDFSNSGFMIDGKIYTTKSIPKNKKPLALSKIIVGNADKKYYLTTEQIKKFKYLRGSKKILRTSKTGKQYYYSEGAMSSYDSLLLPSRTMLTSEGSVNRTSHIILDPKTKKLRFLTPVECERLNGFPDNWTECVKSDRRRYFLMGNALVCGIIKTMSKKLEQIIKEE